MKKKSQNNPEIKGHRYDHLFVKHPVKNDWFGNYVNFEGGQQFNTHMSALYTGAPLSHTGLYQNGVVFLLTNLYLLK